MSDESRLSDADLVRDAVDGDAMAFRRIVERYESRVAATVIGMLGRSPEVDDVGQETFIRLHRALPSFRGDAALGTYITRIAINQSLKAIRKRQSWRARFFSRDGDDYDAVEPIVEDDPIADNERSRIVHEALQHLNPDHRAVVVLRMLEEYSTRETAEMLGIAEGTVMSRLSRAMARLERILGPIIREPDIINEPGRLNHDDDE